MQTWLSSSYGFPPSKPNRALHAQQFIFEFSKASGLSVDAGAAGRDHDGLHHGLRLDPESRFRPGIWRGDFSNAERLLKLFENGRLHSAVPVTLRLGALFSMPRPDRIRQG